MTALLLALAAAVFFGLGSAVQHRAASGISADEVGMMRLSARLVRHPRWLVGKLADLLAVLTQAVALAKGALIAVQGVVTAGIVVAVATGALLDHRRPAPTEITGSLLVVGGTTLLVGVGRPEAVHRHPSAVAWTVVLVVVTLGVAAVARSAAHGHEAARRRRLSPMLGGAAGVCFAVGSGCLKAGGMSLERHGLTTAVALGLVGFLLTSIAGNVLVQRAFQFGPLSRSLPVLTAIEPLVALVLGTVVFHERFSGGVGLVVGGLGVAVLLVGVYVVTRYEAEHPPPTPHVEAAG